MDELERALRAVLDDPAQLQELRELAGSMGFSVPQAQPERAPVPDPPESEPKPVQAVFQQQPLPEPAAAMLRQAGKMDKRSGRKRSTGRCMRRGWQVLRVWL